MKLRQYQQDAVDCLFNWFKHHREGNPLIALPTGTGKSLVNAEIVRRVMRYPKQRVLMLTHVKELIEQNFDKLLKIWPDAPAGIYAASCKRRDYREPIIFASIASVYKRAALFGRVNLIIIDEAHLCSPNGETMYMAFIEKLREANPKIRVVGLTATPYRIGKYKGKLTDNDGLFTDICFDLTGRAEFNKLIDEGYLALLVPKKTKTEIDTDGVKLIGGDYNQKQLAEVCDNDIITAAAIEEILAEGRDRKHWLIFAASIEHCGHIVEALRISGISAAAVHSKMTDDRASVLKAAMRGEIRALVNYGVLTTGFDFPAIDLIAVLRPTQSPGLHVQILGRGTRPAPGKTSCKVLDFAGNIERLGPVNDPLLPRPGLSGKGKAPTRICPDCMTINHAAARHCIDCGHEFPRDPHPDIDQRASTLAVVARDDEELQIERLPVERVDYAKHVGRKSGMTTLCVSYFCGLLGLQQVREWISFNSAWRSRSWWLARSPDPVPTSVEAALELCDTLATPNYINVVVNGKFPQIIGYEFINSDKSIEVPF